jgi:hypothetical protein
MTPNKRDLKAFVRFDGSGRVVSSSLILRKQKPKVGKWMEVQAYQCCNGPSVTTTPGDTLPANSVRVIINCPATEQSVSFILVGGPYATVVEVVAALNFQFSFIGTFAVADNGTDITVTLSADMAAAFRTCLADITVNIEYNYL